MVLVGEPVAGDIATVGKDPVDHRVHKIRGCEHKISKQIFGKYSKPEVDIIGKLENFQDNNK